MQNLSSHSRTDFTVAPAACALCHATADLVHEPPCERHGGGHVCRSSPACMGRVRQRVRERDAAYHQTHEIGGEG